MKRDTVIFARDNYGSLTGQVQVHDHKPELFGVLGQAAAIRLHVRGIQVSDAASCKVTIAAFESAIPDQRPGAVGKPLGTPTGIEGANLTSSVLFDIPGPFCHRVEVQLQVEDKVNHTAAQWWIGEVWATLILEE